MNVKEFIKRIIKDTFLEKPVLKINSIYYYLMYPQLRKGRKYDQQTLKVLQKVLPKDANCIDVGCNRGEILASLLQIAPYGTHFAFEPIPNLFKELTNKFPQVKLYNCALSNEVGETIFYYVVSNDGFSGLKKRPYISKSPNIQEIKVKIDKLDNIIPIDIPIHFIKIDTEGAEWLVILGAQKIIETHKPIIIFEFEKKACDIYYVNPEIVYDFFKNMSYKISLMDLFLKNKGFLSKEKFLDLYNNEKEFYFLAYYEKN